MNYITLTIETKSYLLASSGEGSALIDSEIILNKYGFPILPARRIKGLLKESIQEVLEITNHTDPNSVIIDLFGVSGSRMPSGKLRFNNLNIIGWENISEKINEAININKFAFSSQQIKQYYTTEIQQTALDEKGIAKNHSLRTYRVLNPGYTFQGIINLSNSLDNSTLEILTLGALNLRFAGTRRNRGFGRIKCILQYIPLEVNSNIDNVISTLQDSSSEKKCLAVSITTRGPVILSQQKGDQNTVSTDTTIGGNRVRGLLATRYIKSKGYSFNNAHEKDDFKNIFLSGKVIFSNCQPESIHKLPLNIHEYKARKNEPPIDILQKTKSHASNQDQDSKSNFITKPIDGYGSLKNNLVYKISVATTFNFHTSRLERAAGKSTEDNPGIFYYESIDEGQIFIGKISGDKVLIDQMLAEFKISEHNSIISDNLGRSKSAQYGNITLSFDEIKLPVSEYAKLDKKSHYYMILKSDLVLLNKNGHFESNIETLKCALNNTQLTIINATARIASIEQYNSAWQSKSGKVQCYIAGSVFEILINLTNIDMPNNLGEWTENGFGQIEWLKVDYVSQALQSNGGTKKDQNIEKSTLITKEYLQIIQNYNSELYNIALKHNNKLAELNIKIEAQKEANKCFDNNSSNISGNLIGRMIGFLEFAKTDSEIESFLKEIKDKPAGQTLLKSHLIKNNIFIKYNFAEIGNFESDKLYWITFFKSLRLRMKFL